MKNVTTTLTTNATFSDDGTKRYLLTKTWDADKPKIAVIMMAPSEASGVSLDTTTMLVLNNTARMGYGGVTILNLFATLNDFDLKMAEVEDAENLQAIVDAAKEADLLIYAAGVGKATNKLFQMRQRQVLEALKPMENKLFCLCNKQGEARLQHPLSPAVRTWELSPLKVAELLPKEITSAEQPKKGKKKADKEEPAA